MRFLADENFNGKILNGLRQAISEIEILRVQDTEMYQASDPDLLAWAAENNYILLTHDIQTIMGFAYARVKEGLPMPGVIEVSASLSIGQAIKELSIMIGASTADEFENQVKHIPIH